MQDLQLKIKFDSSKPEDMRIYNAMVSMKRRRGKLLKAFVNTVINTFGDEFSNEMIDAIIFLMQKGFLFSAANNHISKDFVDEPVSPDSKAKEELSKDDVIKQLMGNIDLGDWEEEEEDDE